MIQLPEGEIKEKILEAFVYSVGLLVAFWVIGLVLSQVPPLQGWISVFQLPSQIFGTDIVKLLIGTAIGVLITSEYIHPKLMELIKKR